MHNQILFGLYIFPKVDIWAETVKKNVKYFAANVSTIVYETVSGDHCARSLHKRFSKYKPRLGEKCRHTRNTTSGRL